MSCASKVEPGTDLPGRISPTESAHGCVLLRDRLVLVGFQKETNHVISRLSRSFETHPSLA